jgi:hypothetical protein
MATAAVLSPEDAHSILLRWQEFGPGETEHDAFVEDALAQLNDSEQVKTFQDNISQIADAAMQIDKTFSDIDRTLDWLAKVVFPLVFPELLAYYNQWKDFKNRWRDCLFKSSAVAADSIDFLTRFDTVYLNMVEQIQTDQDRIAAINALREFTEERHDGSVEMSQGFLGIKRDIEAFVASFDQWAIDKNIELEQQAKQLRKDIDGLQKDIESLDVKIKDAKLALAISGGLLFFIGLIVAKGVLNSLQSQRRSKADQLSSKQSQLEAIKLQQQLLGQLICGFDGWKPDIALICDKLVVFAETWSSVRSQTVQFREHLLGGMDAVTNLRFKMEVRLARAVCLPLIEGLVKYKAAIDNPVNWT